MSKAAHVVLTIFRVVLFVVTAVTLIISPFVMKVWKEGEGRELSIKKAQKQKQLKTLLSKSAAVEIDIKELTSNRRLEQYAAENLQIKEAKPENVVVLIRESDGQAVEKKVSNVDRLKEMIKPE